MLFVSVSRTEFEACLARAGTTLQCGWNRLEKNRSDSIGSEPREPEKPSSNASGYSVQVERRGRRRTYLPLEQRIRIYNDVLRLRIQGLSYNRIIERIHHVFEVRLNESQVSYWVRGIRSPLGRVISFDANPTPELAAVIAAILSDGSKFEEANYHYTIKLAVKDRDFAEAFAHCLAKALGRKEPYKTRYDRSIQSWVVRGYSILLYRFLDRPLHELRPFIEHCRRCIAAFLRTFFDAEGSINERSLTVYNTNRGLLIYIQHLLRYFDIEATGPHEEPHDGMKTCYYLYVRAHCLQSYFRYVGFTIKRKQLRLISAIQ